MSDEIVELQGEGAAAEWVSIDTIHPWPENPRDNAHAIPEIARSLENYGWGRPIICRRENREIAVGHTAFEAAKLLGLRKVPVRFVDWSETKAHAYAIADNKLGELSQWNDRLLLAEVKKLEEQGVDPGDMGLAEEDVAALDKLANESLPDQTDSSGTPSPENVEWNPATPDENFVKFSFGSHSGMVSRELYDDFAKRLGEARAADPNALIDDVLREWVNLPGVTPFDEPSEDEKKGDDL